MSLMLRQQWKDAMIPLMESPEFDYTSAVNLASQWIIVQLSEKQHPFRVINLGAGVKRITRKVDTCPKCHGTGRV